MWIVTRKDLSGMAIEVFNRREIKYSVPVELLRDVRDRLEQYMTLDAYCTNGTYTVSNIYFDTEDSELIRRSLSKPKYKEKVRLRAYGVPDPEDLIFLEIKKKFKGQGNKRRTRITHEEAEQFILTGKKPKMKEYMNPQVINELKYILQGNNLSPKLYLAYDRVAYFSADTDLRITIDTNIRTRRYDLDLTMGDYGESLISDELSIMEVKSMHSFPLWMVSILTDFNINKISFSKYGTEYKNLLREQLLDSRLVIAGGF